MSTNPLNEFAPWPRTAAEVTAESLARSLTVQAQANWTRMLSAGPASEAHTAANRVIDVYAIVKLLKTLQAVAPDTADEVARDLWSDLRDAVSIGEWLHSWLTEYGIDPERVDAAASHLMREAA